MPAQRKDDPAPAIHEMAGPPGNQANPGGVTFAQDQFGINVHSNADSRRCGRCINTILRPRQ